MQGLRLNPYDTDVIRRAPVERRQGYAAGGICLAFVLISEEKVNGHVRFSRQITVTRRLFLNFCLI